MFRLERLRPLFRPNALLRSRSPAFMHSSHGGVLPRSVVRLTCDSTAKGGICYVYLIGAVNYSLNFHHDFSYQHEKNCQEVKALLNSVEPQVVFLGLCPSRARDVKTFFKAKSGFQMAYEEAQRFRRNIVFGDRYRNITTHRMTDGPSLTTCLLLFLSPNKALLKSAEPVESKIMKVFVDERDQYMSAKLLKVAREHTLVVAVVGECHLPGIRKYWKQPVEVKQLNRIPIWNVAYLVKKKVSSGFSSGFSFCT